MGDVPGKTNTPAALPRKTGPTETRLDTPGEAPREFTESKLGIASRIRVKSIGTRLKVVDITPGKLPPWAEGTVPEVNHRKLKDQQAEVFRALPEAGTIAVSNRGAVDGVLVEPQRYAELLGAAERGQRMESMLPWLISAAAAGAAVPSDALAALGVEIPFDWQRLDDFLTAFPLQTTHDEHGQPLAAMPDAQPQAVVEHDEEELVYDDGN